MSPPGLSVEEEVVPSPANYMSQNILGLKERNYLGLPDCSSVDCSSPSPLSAHENTNLNLKATELRLGLPGSLSPEREPNLSSVSPRTFDEKLLFPLLPSKEVNGFGLSSNKNVVSGSKRGFSDTINEFLEVKDSSYAEKKWMLNGGSQAATKKDVPKSIQDERSNAKIENCQAGDSTNNSNTPDAKAQVVGWPPIRSYRKNTLATSSKTNDEAEEKPSQGALFVKVSMDGAPYLRKIDLRTYTSYPELSSALEKMFSCFTLGQYRSRGTSGKEMLNEIKLKDLLHGSENVLTYEDKDGDWMLVGDVPWEMFIDSCRKLKIMKSSDAIGLAPRLVEKSKNKV